MGSSAALLYVGNNISYQGRAKLETIILVALFAGCMLLQRFALPLGNYQIQLAMPITFAALLALVASKRAFIDMNALILYIAFLFMCVFSSVSAYIHGVSTYRTSVYSLLNFVVLYLPFVFRLSKPADALSVLKLYQNLLIGCSGLGIIQFCLQFFGVYLFSFSLFVPEGYSYEAGYNVVVPHQYGSDLFKSNGFFMLEPSVFSQYLALGLIFECLFFKRARVVALFTVALILCISGTGIAILLSFALIYAISIDLRNLVRTIFILMYAAGAMLVAYLVAPEVGELFYQRMFEFREQGSSGFQRFLAPWLVAKAYLTETSWFFGLGPGSGEHLNFEILYSPSTFWKVLLDYGIFTLVAFYLLLVYCIARRGFAALSVAVFTFFSLCGGYQQLPAVIYLLLALFVWPDWAATEEDRYSGNRGKMVGSARKFA